MADSAGGADGTRRGRDPSRPLTALVFARSTNGFYFGGQIAGLTREVAARGGRVVIVQTVDPNDEADRVVRIPEFDLPVAWDQVDGAVVVSLSASAPVVDRFRASGKPVVLTHPIGGISAPLALPDNGGTTAAAVEHLIAHGHRCLAFVGYAQQADLDHRATVFRQVVREHGLAASAHHVIETRDASAAAALEVVDTLLALEPRPTAVVAATDRTAHGLLDGLRARGVRIPQDMALIGHDDIPESSFSHPPLSSVSLRFDAVGALAGRMLVDAVDGAPWPARAHHPRTASVAARASCGCTPDLLDVSDGRDFRPLPASLVGLDVARETGDALRHGLAGGPEADEMAARVTAAVERVTSGTPHLDDARTVLSGLARLRSAPDLLHPTVNSLWQLLHRSDAVGREPEVRDALATELWHLHADALQQQVVDLETLIGEQYGIASALLQKSGEDLRRLSWLHGTHVRAGVLALWRGAPESGRLEVAGVYDPHGALGEPVGIEVDVGAFPPRAMVDLARAEAREACFVVPVRTAERRWGLLAVVGDVDPSSAHSHYHYWAALLASVLEEQDLERSLRRSEERYAYAAQAANDGLWEYDVATGTLYASARFRELLGVGLDTDLGGNAWFDNIRSEDLPRVRAAMRQLSENAGTPVNVEFRASGAEPRWLLARGLAVLGPDGLVHKMVGSLSDIHPRKELEQRLRHGALYDDITGLPNRRLFLERLSSAIHHTIRRPSSGYAMIFLDLDGFKLVNDSLGHLAGDQLLTVVADRLRSQLRAEDTAARFGGDEFAVLLLDPDQDEVLAIAARIQEAIAEPVVVGGQEVSVSASAGVATSLSGYRDVSDVLRDADTAMYAAKDTEPGSASVYDPQMHARARERLRQRGELRTALAEQQFVVHYQPVVALDGSPLGRFEALVRWQHPARGLLLPGDFLPAIEDTSLAVPLGRWIIDEVCRQIAAWRAEGLLAVVAVNLSHQEFWAPDLVEAVRDCLARHEVPPENLHVEITETVVMDDAAAAPEVMGRLRALGLGLSIDDFGTGQSSLHALRSLPADVLKIDGSFVRRLGEVQTAELVRIIVEIGQVLGLQTTAECVEQPEQAELLRSMGCTFGQGWLWSKAVPATDAAVLLRSAAAAAATSV